VCGSEISSVRVPMAKEEAIDNAPTNLSDILLQANETRKTCGYLIDSRDDLIDHDPILTSSSYTNLETVGNLLVNRYSISR
jgi:hypothetical protein